MLFTFNREKYLLQPAALALASYMTQKLNKSVTSARILGRHCASGDTQTSQLKNVCLALKSGPKETVEILTYIYINIYIYSL